jgi:exodeoxyribonuclease VIII
MSNITVGAHADVPFKEYLSWEAVSKHDLDLVSKSPAHYRASKLTPTETTPAMHFGTAAHAWILEPETAARHVAIAPKIDRRTKDGKAQWAEFEMMHANKTHINSDDARHLSAMSAAVNNHKIAKELLKSRKGTEVSVLWQDPRTKSMCRCRPDLVTDNIIVDLKTTYDASKAAFMHTVHKYRYHVQAAYYLDGCRAVGLVPEVSDFIFIAVEKKPPYGVAVYHLAADDIDRGRFQYERDLTRYTYAFQHNHWFGYSESIDTIELPYFARKEIDILTANE